MFPLRDNIRSRRTPYVTYTILSLNVTIFAVQFLLRRDGGELFYRFMVVPAAYTAEDPNIPWLVIPLFTSMFMHAGWMHLGGNMLYLWIFADNVEDRLGHVRFAIFYLLCGLGAIFIQMITDPSSELPYLGASGAIGGVLGAYMITYPRARVLTVLFLVYFIHFVEVPAVIVLGFWILVQFFNGIGSLNPDITGGIAWWAHVGGFMSGIALMLVMAPRREREGGRGGLDSHHRAR